VTYIMVKSIAAAARTAVSLVVTSFLQSARDSDGLVDRAGLPEHLEHEVGDVGARDGPAAPDVLPVGRAVGTSEGFVSELWWPYHCPVQAAAGQDVLHLREVGIDLAEHGFSHVTE